MPPLRTPLRTFLATATPASVLLRQVLLFSALDVVFLGFAMAYAFKHWGLPGALLYLCAQYITSAVGFVGTFIAMQSPDRTPAKLLRRGLGGMLLGMLLMGAYSPSWWGLLCLTLAGAGRGMAWAARQWLEMHHTKGEVRERFLALLQTGATLFKLGGPLVAAALMYATSENFGLLFGSVGALGFLTLWATRAQVGLETPPPGPARPLQTLRDTDYWKTAPFYILGGAGSSLRQALFVSGTMTVVGSVSGYGVIDALSSLAAAGFLAWMARRPKAGPSLPRLQFSLAFVGVSWLLLLGALKWPWLLAGFVAFYSFGNPLLISVKTSLVLKGLTSATSAPHDNAMAREMLLVVSRMVALGIAAVLAQANPHIGLLLVVGLVLLLLPFEYLFARELSQRPNV